MVILPDDPCVFISKLYSSLQVSIIHSSITIQLQCSLITPSTTTKVYSNLQKEFIIDPIGLKKQWLLHQDSISEQK